jgi:hypothetical protein
MRFGVGLVDFLLNVDCRTSFKKRILVQDQGGGEFQTADIRLYFEDLKLASNTEIGPKGLFEVTSRKPQPIDKDILH